jgi:hypothetical protein
MTKVIVVYTDYDCSPVLFDEQDREIANAYLKAFGNPDACFLETVETRKTTLEEIAQDCGRPLILVQKWAKEDTEAEWREREAKRLEEEKLVLEARIAELQRKVDQL